MTLEPMTLGAMAVDSATVGPAVVTAGPLSAWSLVVIVGWLVVVALVWLLLFAYGRNRSGGAPEP